MNDWPKDSDIHLAPEMYYSEAAERMRCTQMAFLQNQDPMWIRRQQAENKKKIEKTIELLAWLKQKQFELDKKEREMIERYHL